MALCVASVRAYRLAVAVAIAIGTSLMLFDSTYISVMESIKTMKTRTLWEFNQYHDKQKPSSLVEASSEIPDLQLPGDNDTLKQNSSGLSQVSHRRTDHNTTDNSGVISTGRPAEEDRGIRSSHQRQVTGPPTHEESDSNVKTILYWTTHFGKDWETTWRRGKEAFERCKYKECTVTSDKSKLSEANLLLFFYMEKTNFPDVRYPRQLYAHVAKDPPRTKTHTYLDQYEDILNLTGNYRPSADVYSPYGYYRPLDKPKPGNYTPNVPFGKRRGSIAWMVSHCKTNSQRHLYVNELKRYIDVDIYGACGNQTCPKDLGYNYCFEQLAENYKFYLAFENSICPEYISEKMSHAMDAQMVPIVFGMSNYTHNTTFTPPHSVIDVRDFNSPKDLAKFLKGMTEKEYNEYFQWKESYGRFNTGSMLCSFCEILHGAKYKNGGRFVPSYKEFGGYRTWWQDSCGNDLILRMKQEGGW